jgi:hypothetical protein
MKSIYVTSNGRELADHEDRMKPPKKIPTFKDEGAEREFWAKANFNRLH